VHDDPPMRGQVPTDVVPSALAAAPVVGRGDVRSSPVRGVTAIENDLDALRRVVLPEIDVELKLVALDDD